MGNSTFLVVGGDSLVGGGLIRALARRGHRVIASTRRQDSVNEQRVFLDFESSTPFVAPKDVDYAFIVAAATNYTRCESDPLARTINVDLIPNVAESLLQQGLFVTFISTNSVFGGARPWPGEEDAHEPGIAYAKQKHEAECAIRSRAQRLEAEGRFNIVRLTKILDRNTSPLPAWISTWKQGGIVEPFSDLIFAPLSVQYAGDALATIGERRVPGDLHLSGSDNVCYVDFALSLATRMGVDSRFIAPSSATEKGIHIAFKPRYSGLGMRRTTKLTGVLPQSLTHVVDDLLAEN